MLPSGRVLEGRHSILHLITYRRSWFMKRLTITLAVLAMMMSTAALAEDGAALYQAKCAACHGAGGEGKAGPAIKGKDVSDVLDNGGKKGIHAKPFNVSPDQAKAIGVFVAALK
jgi:mono/diheme cytochrome c family protein